MLVYVVVQLVEDFESEATKPDVQDMAAPKVCPDQYILSILHMNIHVLCSWQLQTYAKKTVKTKIFLNSTVNDSLNLNF